MLSKQCIKKSSLKLVNHGAQQVHHRQRRLIGQVCVCVCVFLFSFFFFLARSIHKADILEHQSFHCTNLTPPMRAALVFFFFKSCFFLHEMMITQWGSCMLMTRGGRVVDGGAGGGVRLGGLNRIENITIEFRGYLSIDK